MPRTVRGRSKSPRRRSKSPSLASIRSTIRSELNKKTPRRSRSRSTGRKSHHHKKSAHALLRKLGFLPSKRSTLSSVKSVLRKMGALPTTYDEIALGILGQIGFDDVISSPLEDLLGACTGDLFDLGIGGGCGATLLL